MGESQISLFFFPLPPFYFSSLSHPIFSLLSIVLFHPNNFFFPILHILFFFYLIHLPNSIFTLSILFTSFYFLLNLYHSFLFNLFFFLITSFYFFFHLFAMTFFSFLPHSISILIIHSISINILYYITMIFLLTQITI